MEAGRPGLWGAVGPGPGQYPGVLGTAKPARVRESAAGSDVQLTREEWYSLFRAGGHIVP